MARNKECHINPIDKEFKQLKFLLCKSSISRTVRCRCQILLDMDEIQGELYAHEQCVKSNGVCSATMSNTIRHYIEEGIDSVIKLKRSLNSNSAKRKVDGRSEAKLIEIACGPVLEGYSR